MKRKMIILTLGASMLPFMLLILLVIGMFGGGGNAVLPVEPFATEEEAYGYQYVGTELGVPWDIVLLADGLHAQENDQKNMKEYNPLITSLQFCILSEKKYELEVTVIEEDVLQEDGTIKKVTTTETEWEYRSTQNYIAKENILQYAGVDESGLPYADVNKLITLINQAAENKSTETVKYEVVLTLNPNYEKVLREFIQISEENIRKVLQLYRGNYMAALYGYSYQNRDIELPEITIGELSPEDLAAVAVSLLNHPYLMGGKYSQQGVPDGALDCSGYVDWVYIQCFGQGVSSGRLPEGVAVSGTALMWYACEEEEESELRVGDLGFLYDPAEMGRGQVNHVGIYLGSHDGQDYWIHCGGSYYGTEESPTGRVGISTSSGMNNYNPVDGSTFDPPMKSCNFNYFRRPQFEYTEE